MFYRFKKLFYIWMTLVGVFFLVSAKPQTKKKATVTLTQSSGLFDIINQTTQGFLIQEAILATKDDNKNAPTPANLQNLKKYYVISRYDSDPNVGLYITLTDEIKEPDDKTSWNDPNSRLPIPTSKSRSGNLWGWTVDEIGGVIYTLESVPGTEGLGSDMQAQIHAYVINKGDFSEIMIDKDAYISPKGGEFGFNRALQMKNGLKRPIIPMAYLNGQIFFADDDRIFSAEAIYKDNTDPQKPRGIPPKTCHEDSSQLIGRLCLPGYEIGTGARWIQSLSTISTPNEGNLLMGATTEGYIAVVTYDSLTKILNIVYDNTADSNPALYYFRYPSNFKMSPIVYSSGSSTETLYSLTFVANAVTDSANPQTSTLNQYRRVFYLPIVIQIDNSTNLPNNKIDWLNTFNPASPNTYDPNDDYNSGDYHPFDNDWARFAATKYPHVPMQKNNHTIQIIAPVTDTNIPSSLGIQYMTTLFYDNPDRNNTLMYGNSSLSARMHIRSDVKQEELFDPQTDSRLTDNIIGVIYGVPPFYTPNVGRDSVNQISITWAKTDAETQTSGFSIDAFFAQTFSAGFDIWIFKAKVSDTFSVFSDFKKSFSQSTRLMTTQSFTMGDASDSSELNAFNLSKQTWDSDTGWLIISRGYTSYDLYSLTNLNPNSDIHDRNKRTIVPLTLAPSPNGILKPDTIPFRLSTGELQPDMQKNSPEYLSGMTLPRSPSSIKDINDKSSYWLSKSATDIANGQSDYDKYTGTLTVAGAGSSSTATINIAEDTQVTTEGDIGGGVEIKTNGTIFGLGGGYNMKFSAAYNYGTNTLFTHNMNWMASSNTVKNTKTGIDQIDVVMNLLTPKPNTDKKYNRPFWIPQWAWDKGNRPWLITWTATSGRMTITQTPPKPKKKHTKTVSSPKSSPAQTTSSIN